MHGEPLRALVDDLGGGLGPSGLRYGPLLMGGCPLHGVVHDENAAVLGGVADTPECSPMPRGWPSRHTTS
ncbi:hypothetical protein [Nocardiopsis sp. CA-288880]|uniref:hypothetical protein n=1 Tax=Nocardiopsis sp. CA-288880 TaxID=3239995 RepID=UPI003D989C69